ncbi:MAG: dTDP-4-dehydrorhamnose reductase [Patescibacteria group bacterium]
MSILLLGAQGQLGEALGDVLPKETLKWGRGELDLTQIDSIAPKISEAHPNVVINAAAMTDVDGCEINRALAVKINEDAPCLLAKVCKSLNSLLVQVSTDYVFGYDETRKKPYNESDTPHAINYYGITKLEGERKIIESGCEYLILRTSGLYGKKSMGSNYSNYVEKVLTRARSQEEIRATTDQIYSPTYAQEFTQALISLIEQNQRGLLHLVNVGEVSRYEFTQAIIELAGLPVRVVPALRKDFSLLAQRPSYSALTSERIELFSLMSDWKTALQNYIKERVL